MAVDITLRHYLTATGGAQAQASEKGERLLAAARGDKERKYSELLVSRRCKLVVIALSTGGRWSSEALKFVNALAFAKARAAPHYLRKSAWLTWQRRWVRMLSIAAANSFATGLLVPAKLVGACALDGAPLELCDLFAERGDS